jgi:hypothetical protein
MTPEQAIAILTNATAMLPANRAQHQEIIAALNVLTALIAPKSPPQAP